ncbi:MAG: hypothetical protein M0021_11050 [Clostridia bacterium]|nr:hypothetical protein [Clostridia bacterium]
MGVFLKTLFYFIESSLLATAGPGLLGVKLKGKSVLLIGFLHSLSVWGLRTLYQALKIPFGSHTLVLAFLMCLLLWQIARLPFFEALGGTAISFTLLLVSEPLVLIPLVRYLNLTFELVQNNPLLFFPIALAGDSLLLLAVIIGYFRKNKAD